MFFGIFLIYRNIYPNPRNWYDHYLYLSKSLIQGRADIPNLPLFYHDKLEFNGKTFIPFPPGASFILVPLILIDKGITQQQASILIGSIDITLIYFLLKRFTDKKNSLILSIFLGLGTSFFWSSVVGTTWFFAHIVAVFYLILSLLLLFSTDKKSFKKTGITLFLSGIFFALAGLTRYPILASGLFFVFYLWRDKLKLLAFLSGTFFFIPIQFYYNFLRFGSIFESGYTKIYDIYTKLNYTYSIERILFPTSPHFNYFDIRAVPYHIYTFLFMPPDKGFKPSPYGMGILFTSPLLFISLIPKFKTNFEKIIYFSMIPTIFLIFCHYAQGWVQFGYRFVLDFIVFLMIILALKFKLTKLNLLLILISIVVNFWGVSWAINLGW